MDEQAPANNVKADNSAQNAGQSGYLIARELEMLAEGGFAHRHRLLQIVCICEVSALLSPYYLLMSSRQRALVLALSLFAFTTPVAPAVAHTELVSAIPAVDSVVDSWPSKIQLTFNEDLASLGQSSAMQLTAHNAIAEEVSEGNPTVVGSTISVPLTANPTQGLVLVSYRVASQDGHVVEGEYTFTFGKSSPGSAPYLAVKKKDNTAIYGASTVLVVLTLLFGIWAYRRRRD